MTAKKSIIGGDYPFPLPMEHIIALVGYAQSHALAILACIILSYVVGSVWHGPLFGKQWMAYNKITPPKKEDMKFSMMVPGLVASFFHMLVMTTVMGRTFELVALANVWQALLIAFILWFAFLGLAFANSYAWEGKPVGHWAISAGYYLVMMLASAAILYAMM